MRRHRKTPLCPTISYFVPMNSTLWNIRPACQDDIPAMHAIAVSGFANPWAERMLADELAQDCVLALAAISPQNVLVGYLFLSAALDEAQLRSLAVSPRHRRCGVARQLLNHAWTWARKRNARSVFLEVREDNDSALTLYKTVNFTECGRRRGYYPGGVDALVMKREL